MNSEWKMFFDELLINEEKIVWIGRPVIKPYKIRNIEWMLIDFTKKSIFCFVVFFAYYFLLQKEFFPRADVYSLVLFLLVILIINIATLIKKVGQADSVVYCITDKRVLITSNHKKQKIKIIEKNEIKKKKIIGSATDREYKVQTVKLVIEEEDAFIESIENGDTVMRLL